MEYLADTKIRMSLNQSNLAVGYPGGGTPFLGNYGFDRFARGNGKGDATHLPFSCVAEGSGEVQGEGFAVFDRECYLVSVLGRDRLHDTQCERCDCLAFGRGDLMGAVERALEDRYGGFTVPPCEVDLEPAPRSQAAEGPRGPGFWKGR